MISFSVNNVSGVDWYANHVWDCIQSNLGYFKKFNGPRWEEAVQQTYLFILDHRNDSYGDDILPYIKKLARLILKKKFKDSPYGVFTEDGEISPVFATLQDYIDTTNLDGRSPLMNTFKELYLLDSESFMRLKLIFDYDNPSEIENLKDLRVKNTQLTEEFTRIIQKHGSDYVFASLYQFFKMLPDLIKERYTNQTKEVVIKPSNFTALSRINDKPTIIDEKGKQYKVDRNSLLTTKNPDYFKWDIVGSSLCDILKIDISQYMNYMYEETYVQEGVHTHHIEWCGDKFKLTTPGGTPYIGLDFEKFLTNVRIELLLNLMLSNVGSVIAISPDSLYVKPTRVFQFDKIRVKMLHTGKVIDLPITTHIHKTKKSKK